MKKILMTLVLLVGIVAGLFAQKLTYQAVIRDNNLQLVVNTAVKATVTIDFAGDQADYTTTIADVSTNLHGLLTIEFGDGSLVGRDWTNATIAVKVVNAATPSIVYVNDEPRPVSAVPYALSVDGVAIQQYLTEHKYVTEMQVGNQIHDSISNVAGKFHTHDNMAILNATEATYTKADSLKLKGIADSAEVNVQSDWKQTDGSKDDYIKNKPSIMDTVNGILSTGGYVTADALDSRHYLRSDSTVITTMQNDIVDLKASQLDCDKVKDCIKDTLSKYTPTADLTGLLQQLEARLTGKIDSLAHLVDSLAKLPHGGGEVADGQPCPGAPTVSDGTNTYNTVKIGNQCWMAQNLRTDVGSGVYPKKNDGRDDLTPDEQVTYGRLYTWTAMMNDKTSSDSVPSGVQGICPTGWHVPSDAEWTQLTNYVNKEANEFRCNGEATIANALSAATGWTDPDECCAGYSSETLNKTGFSAVPAGRCLSSNFYDFDTTANFWSATQNGDYRAWYRSLGSDDSYVNSSSVRKDLGFSVRCLRDAGTGGGGTTPVPVEVSCEQVMECMGDTLGKLNTKIENLKNTVDSLAALIPGGDTTEVADGQPCPGAPTVSDGTNTYNTVKIGSQCWMKENLRTTTKRNNAGNIYTNNTTRGYNAETYGYYYDWAAVMQNEYGDKVRGICPTGWHVPSDAEWTQLTTYVNSVEDYKCNSGYNNIANALSSPTGWNNSSTFGCNAGDANEKRNLTGFAAVPAGGCFTGNFRDFGNGAYFWSATQIDASYARYRYLHSFDSGVFRNLSLKDAGYSVRCLRDAGTGGGGTTPVPVEVSCEQVMECMGDTLGKLNTKIENQGQKLDSLAHVVDSLAKLVHGGGEVADGQPCPGAPTVSDGTNTYNTVKIGNQCWMKENLRTTTGLTENTNYWHANDQSANDETYGLLYNWAAVMQDESGDKVQGICPTGWHVPSDAEWDTLTTYVNSVADYKCNNGDKNIANALSAATGWQSPSECAAGHNSTTLNTTGFAAVPAGYCFSGSFSGFGFYAYFWSATQYDDYSAWYRYLLSDVSRVGRHDFDKGYGFSVRCLKDEGGSSATLPTVTTDSASTVTNNSAKLYGNVTDMGEKTEVYAGFKYGTSESALTSIIVKEAEMTATGMFSCDIAGLTADTTYYYQAFIANGTDTVNGATLQFKTKSAALCPAKVTDHQSNEYKVVQIGTNCWMAENLRCTTSPVAVGHTLTLFNALSYADSYYQTSGGTIYNWHAAVDAEDCANVERTSTYTDHRGLCPDGWHLPTSTEWNSINGIIPAGFVSASTIFWTATADDKIVTYVTINNTTCSSSIGQIKGSFYAIRCVKSAE